MWLFPQEKATFDSLLISTSEAKMLYLAISAKRTPTCRI
jgi:hypothetical protein